MGAHREQIDSPALHIHGDLADGLCGIGVKENLAPAADPTDLFDGLEGSDLAVGGHDRSTGRIVRNKPSPARKRQLSSTAGCSMALVIR
jgi:hypothetical protein